MLLLQTARRLKLKNVPQFASVSGGEAVERTAQGGDPQAFEFPGAVMSHHRHCDFSFAGLKYHAQKLIEKEEAKYGMLSRLTFVSRLCGNM